MTNKGQHALLPSPCDLFKLNIKRMILSNK